MKKAILVLLLISSLVLLGCQGKKVEDKNVKEEPKGSKDFVIAGSGTNLPITGKLIQAYEKMSGESIEMPESIGSSGGIKALQQGAIDLALVSRPLKEEEKKSGLKLMAYARVAIVIGVHPSVPNNDITYEELVKIFQGEKYQWKHGETIIVLSREEGDSTNKVLSEKVPGFEKALEESLNLRRWQVYFTDVEEAHAIENTLNSIGFTDSGALGVLGLKIKPLKVNGVEPTVENLQQGRYQLFKDLYLVYKEPRTDQVMRFLEFVRSEEGQKIIRENRGLPIESE